MSATAFDVLTDFGTLEAAARELRHGALLPEDEEAIFNVQNHLIYGTFNEEERTALEIGIAAEAIIGIMQRDTEALGDERFLCVVQAIINL